MTKRETYSTRILLGGLRHHQEDEHHRRLSFPETGRLSGVLHILEEITLAPDQELSIEIQTGNSLLLLPLVGQLYIRPGHSSGCPIIPNNWYLMRESVKVKNTSRELIKFLAIQCPESVSNKPEGFGLFLLQPGGGEMISIGLEKIIAQSVSMGRFGARMETKLFSRKPGWDTFLYVIQGAFEVEGCLIEGGDGLVIRNRKVMEAEALSEDAILLMVS